MLKCSSDRCVCAPHSLVLGTSTSPRLSVSLRTPITATLLIALISFLPSASLSGRTLSGSDLCWQSPLVPFFATPFPESPIANIGRTIHELDTLRFTDAEEANDVHI